MAATSQISASTIDAIKEKARRLGIYSMMSHHRSRLGPSHVLPFRLGINGGRIFLRDEIRSEESKFARMAIASFSRKATPRRFSTPLWPKPACFRSRAS